MSDWYQNLTTSGFGAQLTSTLGLPAAVELRRHEPGGPVLDGPVLAPTAPGSRLASTLARLWSDLGADVRDVDDPGDDRIAAIVIDASPIGDSTGLRAVYDALHEPIRRLAPSGRVIVIGGVPGAEGARHAAAQQALEGIVRSVGKELRAGGTANLVRVAEGAEDGLDSTLRFLCSGRSAFVSGQVIELTPAPESAIVPGDPDEALADRIVVVTGAAQGIGAAIAEVTARAGAHVVCIDIPAQGEALTHVANAVGGSALQLDVTAADAPGALASYLDQRHGGADVIVHNAGITRDKTMAGMDPDRWDRVIDVNLTSVERITDALLAGSHIRAGGRIVCVSSMSGIAGNRGQTNYAASKAGLIGMVRALAPDLRDRGLTINAVAPGFIETSMTGEMPFVVREAGRRMSSLNQGGLPVDVAETIAWLAEPGAATVTGNVIRVCGQNLLGA